MLKKQSDLIFIRERDYITNPKPNGYRSHHIILGVNVFCLDASEYYPVEDPAPHDFHGFLGCHGASYFL